jgi:hypothetical protein
LSAPDDVRPTWFHRHGYKLAIEHYDPEKLELTLASTAARLTITPHGRRQFLVRWRIVNSKNESAEGVIVFTQDHLKAAFMVPVTLPADHVTFLANYDATHGVPGYFVRRGQFLNIPCPGTARDGDPNLSVFLSDDMVEAAKAITRLRAD